MRAPSRRAPSSLAGPIGISAALHSVLFAVVIIMNATPPKPLPPMYKVDIVAAPAGERAAGVVTDAPAPVAPTPPKAMPKVEPNNTAPVLPKKNVKPVKTPKQATPTLAPAKAQPNVAAPKAGGGAVGGKGTDVATVRTEGIDFPFPGYLNNIVRQVYLNFKPRPGRPLKAEVFFMIRRDGTVSGFRFLTRSGDYAFDLEAQGAVESAARAFGGLPPGFSDDVLPVIFSFDPSRIP